MLSSQELSTRKSEVEILESDLKQLKENAAQIQEATHCGSVSTFQQHMAQQMFDSKPGIVAFFFAKLGRAFYC